MSDYPQMPPLTQEEINEFLSQPLLAKICTHNEDGTIHIAPLFFRYEDGDILLGTQAISRKIKNIERNSDVTVLIDNAEPPFKAVVIYGVATLDYDDVIAKRIRLFENYMPADQATGFAQGLAANWEPVIIRVKPSRMVTFDYAKGSLV